MSIPYIPFSRWNHTRSSDMFKIFLEYKDEAKFLNRDCGIYPYIGAIAIFLYKRDIKIIELQEKKMNVLLKDHLSAYKCSDKIKLEASKILKTKKTAFPDFIIKDIEVDDYLDLFYLLKCSGHLQCLEKSFLIMDNLKDYDVKF